MPKRHYHVEYADCPFCGAPYRVYTGKASRCEHCGVVFPKPPPGGKSTDALDHAPVKLSTTTGQAILKILEGESEAPEIGAYPVSPLSAPGMEESELDAKAWAEKATEAQIKAERRPWTLHEAGGMCWLIRWRDRTEELRENVPTMSAPKTPPVFGEVGTVDGRPFVVPLRRRADLQHVLEEHAPGLRLEDVPVFRNRPGRRHPPQESEWERDKAERLRLRFDLERLHDMNPESDLRDHPAARRLEELHKKWQQPKQCKAWGDGLNYCLNFLPRESRQEYCLDACKQAAKRGRRIP